ncbi:unnamed protein product [Phytophthora fragariaefolia]|uniref:Anaphase-promoting complex subunit 4 n=1 Tax=Phytophthora fragariaefolia TaxID=1490495 RepID=A0A9W6X7G7_9STRA|nr:unnamed protein product [Phytophthora fragariaefolia]
MPSLKSAQVDFQSRYLAWPPSSLPVAHLHLAKIRANLRNTPQENADTQAPNNISNTRVRNRIFDLELSKIIKFSVAASNTSSRLAETKPKGVWRHIKDQRMAPPKRAFVALQDRFVSSLAVACCPTMDLVAVLTLDHHLLVHPSNVGFEMVALAWKPDGLQLAVGSDEGDVAVFEIESGEIIPESRSNHRHEHCITAMCWTQIDEVDGLHSSFSSKRRQQQIPGTLEDDSGTSQSKKRFQHRSSRFLANCSDESLRDDTVLVTADECGRIALWWMGRVLVTKIDVTRHFAEEEYQMLESAGCQRGGDGKNGFRIERVDLAPDMSVLFVLLAFPCRGKNSLVGQDTKLHRILTIGLTAIRRIYEHISFVANIVDRVQMILCRVAATGKEISTEWKNATRIFELKMGLIGPLYEKYACEDPPQVDMLSEAVTGITSPALAQYFAQDIQEMSVNRMQKALYSGCNTLRTIVDVRLKRDLVDLIFILSEMRGQAKWSPQAFANTLGITDIALDHLVESAQDALLKMEQLTLALQETHQDFALLFQWMSMRIRVHTSTRIAPGRNMPNENGAVPNGEKSLLNLRRLCDFLHRAAEAAQHFREQQPSHNKYRVETTFGNAVSNQLFSKPVTSENGTIAEGCLSLLKNIQDQWITVMDSMVTTVGEGTVREKGGCFSIGDCNNIVEQCHVHFRHSFSVSKLDTFESDDQSDDEDQEYAFDWDALKHFGSSKKEHEKRSTAVIGCRLKSGVLVMLRACPDTDSPFVRSSHLVWSAAVIRFSHVDSAKQANCQGFAFYGDTTAKNNEQLAFVVNREVGDKMYQGRAVASSAQFSRIAALVIASASRGVLCVLLPPSRLTIFDAEDSEDEGGEDNHDEESDDDEQV